MEREGAGAGKSERGVRRAVARRSGRRSVVSQSGGSRENHRARTSFLQTWMRVGGMRNAPASPPSGAWSGEARGSVASVAPAR